MKKFIISLCIILISFSLYAKDSLLFSGFEFGFSTQEVTLENNGVLASVGSMAPSYGCYLSFNSFNDNKNLGTFLSNTLNVLFVPKEIYISDRINIGASIKPSIKPSINTIIAALSSGIVIQPEFQTAGDDFYFNLLFGFGTDFQVGSKITEYDGYGFSLNVSVYPIGFILGEGMKDTKIKSFGRLYVGIALGACSSRHN